MSIYEDCVGRIVHADESVLSAARERLDSLTKPKGSLGMLEDCAARYAAARGELFADVRNPAIVTFAGDHGVAAEGVSAFPSEVTVQMTANMSNGGAAVNVLARHVGAVHRIVDVGIASDCAFPNVRQRHVADGTRNFTQGPAMTRGEVLQALEVGMTEAFELIDSGSTLLGTGEMGIANTTPSAALYSAFLHLPPEQTCGCGTGISAGTLQHKIGVVRRALEVNSAALEEGPLSVLAALGGLEIAAIAGLILGAASRKVPVVVDGIISGAGAVAARGIREEVMDYCFFSHLSGDAGHAAAMKSLGVRPLLDLGMRLGEGTGAALAMTLIEASVKILLEMATFEEAAVIGDPLR